MNGFFIPTFTDLHTAPYECIINNGDYNMNFSQDMEWQFVANGRTQGERLQEEIGEVTKSSNILIDGLRSFFDRLRNHTKDIEK